MKPKEFIEKWGYTTAEGYGSALFDQKKALELDLKKLLVDFCKWHTTQPFGIDEMNLENDFQINIRIYRYLKNINYNSKNEVL